MNLDILQWVCIILTAFLVGFSKTGIGGTLMLAIPVLASVFGARDSTGIMLPMLLIGDFIAVYCYRHNVEWKKIKILLPWALFGIVLGAVVGNFISNNAFKIITKNDMFYNGLFNTIQICKES
jgi:uncharacterized membrane protein YfcA